MNLGERNDRCLMKQREDKTTKDESMKEINNSFFLTIPYITDKALDKQDKFKSISINR